MGKSPAPPFLLIVLHHALALASVKLIPRVFVCLFVLQLSWFTDNHMDLA